MEPIEYQRQLVEKYSNLRREKSILEARLAEVNNALYDVATGQGVVSELATYMSDSNLKTLRFTDLGAVTLKAPTPRPKYDKENEEMVFEYVKKSGAASIIKETIHPGTFSSFIKEQLSGGVAIPEFIQIYFQPSLMYVKASE